MYVVGAGISAACRLWVADMKDLADRQELLELSSRLKKELCGESGEAAAADLARAMKLRDRTRDATVRKWAAFLVDAAAKRSPRRVLDMADAMRERAKSADAPTGLPESAIRECMNMVTISAGSDARDSDIVRALALKIQDLVDAACSRGGTPTTLEATGMAALLFCVRRIRDNTEEQLAYDMASKVIAGVKPALSDVGKRVLLRGAKPRPGRKYSSIYQN